MRPSPLLLLLGLPSAVGATPPTATLRKHRSARSVDDANVNAASAGDGAAPPPSGPRRPVVDVLAMGSETRPDLLRAQSASWAAAPLVRHHWAFTERGDGTSCASDAAAAPPSSCAARADDLGFGNDAVASFVRAHHGEAEHGVDRSGDPGWLCAQRRIGQVLRRIQSAYGGGGEGEGAGAPPDVLAVVDDDTYLDVEQLGRYMAREEGGAARRRPLARAGCLFDARGSILPYSFPYGGFGTFLNREAVEALARPISCADGSDDRRRHPSCASLAANGIGESASFVDGMSALELFAAYSDRELYCLHSDWLVGYMVQNYIHVDAGDAAAEGDAAGPEPLELAGMATYPRCGNWTLAGEARPCRGGAAACHRQRPDEMEAMAAEKARRVSEGRDVLLPNVLMIGAQKAGTSSVAQWLFENGVCRPDHPEKKNNERYYKEVHFFDEDRRFERGVHFFSERFEHCAMDGDLGIAMDATPDTLMEAERVRDTYVRAGRDLAEDLKMIVILREPLSRELSLFNHKRAEYLKHGGRGKWYSNVADRDGNVRTFEDYVEHVLVPGHLENRHWKNVGFYADHVRTWTDLFPRDHLLVLHYDELVADPSKVQWRIQQFLGVRVPGRIPRINTNDGGGKVEELTERARRLLAPIFERKNRELYDLLDDNPGPWMEQYPFPRFEGEEGGTTKSSSFAYATVLGWNPDELQRRTYLEAALVWIHSIRETGSDADAVVLMNFDDDETEETLIRAGAIVERVGRMTRRPDDRHFEGWFADVAFAKLHAFRLTDYERVQLMDLDVSLGRNLDALFSYAPDARLASEGLGGDAPLRAGWLLIRPSASDFAGLVAIIENGKFDEELGWEHLDLPVEYPGWSRTEGALHKWGFYGSQLEQGLLYHYFYALPKAKDPSATAASLVALLDDEQLNSHGLVHFYGNRKPWGTIMEGLPDYVESAQVRWRRLHRTLKLGAPSSPFQSPLTAYGETRYIEERVLYEYMPELTLSPTHSPTSSPSSSPTVKPTSSPTVIPKIESVVEGGVRWGDDVCDGVRNYYNNGGNFDEFVESTKNIIMAQIGMREDQEDQLALLGNIQFFGENLLSDYQIKITGICDITISDRRLQSSGSRRRLQSSSGDWDVYFDIIATVVCGNPDCNDPQEIAAVAALAQVLSDNMDTSVASGALGTAIFSNPVVLAAIPPSLVGCLAVWGDVFEEEATLGTDLVTVLASPNTTFAYYPDWEGRSGVCLSDGNQPKYMTLNSHTWMFSNLDDCCQKYYPGWNWAKCTGYRGSGLWYVDFSLERCVRDCEPGRGGPTCGGVFVPDPDQLYSDPRTCCETRLGYLKTDYCEAASLLNECFSGTGEWYRDDTTASKLCVTDCDPKEGGTCGGVVDHEWVRLHPTPEQCCEIEHGWIEEPLCVSRSTKNTTSLYWADQSKSKCVDDSDTPATDMSVAIFETAEECCSEAISWVPFTSCIADAIGVPLSAQGTDRYFIHWSEQRCAKICDGPAPCGGTNPAVGPQDVFNDLSSCCDRLKWVERSECELA